VCLPSKSGLILLRRSPCVEWTPTKAQQVAMKHCLLIGYLFGKFS
jgi:hypothetical protein